MHEPGPTFEEYQEAIRRQQERDRDRFLGHDSHKDEPMYDARTGQGAGSVGLTLDRLAANRPQIHSSALWPNVVFDGRLSQTITLDELTDLLKRYNFPAIEQILKEIMTVMEQAEQAMLAFYTSLGTYLYVVSESSNTTNDEDTPDQPPVNRAQRRGAKEKTRHTYPTKRGEWHR